MAGFIVLGGLGFLVFAGVVFLNTSPEFGGKAGRVQQSRYAETGQYEEGKFVNQIPTSMDLGITEYPKLLLEFLRGTPDARPSAPLPVENIEAAGLAAYTGDTPRLRWLGHSAVLLEAAGKVILLDPMLGPSPAPHPWLGGKRFGTLPIEAEELPHIDAVLISHDHYDHLDYGSILALKDKTDHFYVPLGVGAHLEAWGVQREQIHEMAWGEEVQQDAFTFVSTPARHFSGRGLLDRNKTLWCSWVINTPASKLYFSGDSGYGPHFSEIGDQYGPFDFAMIECGQYDLRWEAIHMLPEQSVQAALDLNTRLMMPIHWGAFTLALHSWTDPIERATQEALQQEVAITTPRIGQPVYVAQENFPESNWWQQVGKANP